MLFVSLLSTAALAGISVSAMPLSRRDNTASVTQLSQAQFNDIEPIALFGQASYCSAASILAWQCGPACLAHPTVQPLLAAGDDGLIPGFFTAFDPVTNAIVVAHQGTEPEKLVSDINDIKFALVDTNSTFFSDAPAGTKVHDGFQETFIRTANTVLDSVKKGLADKKASNIIITGHSLGAAIAVMDSIFLRNNIDSSIPIRTTVFGLPRSGNQAWADYVDKKVASLQHMHNDEDIVPQVPPRFLDFVHPQGELFIHSDHTTVESCPGQENENCSAGNSLLEKSILDHFGPYATVRISSFDCLA